MRKRGENSWTGLILCSPPEKEYDAGSQNIHQDNHIRAIKAFCLL